MEKGSHYAISKENAEISHIRKFIHLCLEENIKIRDGAIYAKNIFYKKEKNSRTSCLILLFNFLYFYNSTPSPKPGIFVTYPNSSIRFAKAMLWSWSPWVMKTCFGLGEMLASHLISPL